MKIVLVKWVDAAVLHGAWMSKEELHDLDTTNCISIGILAEETDSTIKLYPYSNPLNMSSPTAIDKNSIKQMWRLKVE